MRSKNWAILILVVAVLSFAAGWYVEHGLAMNVARQAKAMGPHCGSAPNVCVISYRQMKLDEADANHAEIVVSISASQHIYILNPGKDFKIRQIENVTGGKCPANPFSAKIPGNSSTSGQDAFFDSGAPLAQAKDCHYRLHVDDCNGQPCPVDPHIYITQ